MDKHYLGQKYHLSEIEHRIGKKMNVFSVLVLFSYLATLCEPATKQPAFNGLIAFFMKG